MLCGRNGRMRPHTPSINRNHPLARGLVACWLPGRFTGVNIHDHQNMNFGFLYNGPQHTNTHWGPAIHFERASSQYAAMTHTSTMEFSSGISLFMLMVPNLGSTRQILCGKGEGGGPDDTAWLLELTSSNHVVFQTSDGTTNTDRRLTTTDIPITVNRPCLIGGTWDGAIQKAYNNGNVSANTLSWSGALNIEPASTFSIGRTGGLNSHYADIKVSAVFLWSRALSHSQVTALYMNPWELFQHSHYFADAPSSAPSVGRGSFMVI